MYNLLFILLLLVVAGKATSRRQSDLKWGFLFLLVFVDVSASHWSFVKTHLAPLKPVYLDNPTADGFSSDDATVKMGLEKAFLFRTSNDLKNLGGDRLPELSFYSQYHGGSEPLITDLDLALKPQPSIQVDESFLGSASEKVFREGQRAKVVVPISGELKRLSFNTFDIEIKNPTTSLLLIRESFFPGWTAESNGKTIPIHKSLGGLKLIVLTPDMTHIQFKFFPAAVAYSLVVAYLLIGFTALGLASSAKREIPWFFYKPQSSLTILNL